MRQWAVRGRHTGRVEKLCFTRRGAERYRAGHYWVPGHPRPGVPRDEWTSIEHHPIDWDRICIEASRWLLFGAAYVWIRVDNLAHGIKPIRRSERR